MSISTPSIVYETLNHRSELAFLRQPTRNMRTTKTSSWTQLPAEIRLKIIDELIRAVEQDGSSLGPYATVSSEWQAAIEAVNFRTLNISPDMLNTRGFVIMANRAWTLGLVRHVNLSLAIAEYTCLDCQLKQRREIRYDRPQPLLFIDRQAALKVFRLLKGWKGPTGVTLDITVQSPSDACHYFPHMGVGKPRRTLPAAIHDPRHGWENGQRVMLPPKRAVFRMFEAVCPWQFNPATTRTKAVTRLVIRRQTTRRWGVGDLDCLIRDCGGLKEFHYESWRAWTARGAEDVDARKSSPISACLTRR